MARPIKKTLEDLDAEMRTSKTAVPAAGGANEKIAETPKPEVKKTKVQSHEEYLEQYIPKEHQPISHLNAEYDKDGKFLRLAYDADKTGKGYFVYSTGQVQEEQSGKFI